MARCRGLEPIKASVREIDRLCPKGAVHQGVLLEASQLPEPELSDIIQLALADTGPAGGTGPVGRGLIGVLDHVTDPHNVGAIVRSAAVFGVCGLVMTRRNAPPLNGTLAKAASGGLEHVPVVLVTNLARALEELRDAGVMVCGLDAGGDSVLGDERRDGALAVVLGAEDRGLRRLTRENCDRVVSISTAQTMTSLNVSNAAAIAFHALGRVHDG